MNPNFPLDRYFDQFPKDITRPYLPAMYPFFGKRWDGIDEFIERFWSKYHLLQFYLGFKRPSRNSEQYMREICAHLSQVVAPRTQVIICPVLEDEMSNEAWRAEAKKIRKISPFPLVRNSLIQNTRGGKYEERHGKQPKWNKRKNRIYNPDGVSVNFRDGEDYRYKMSRRRWRTVVKTYKPYSAAIWTASAQGLQGVDHSSQAPPVNERDYIITDKAIIGMRRMLS